MIDVPPLNQLNQETVEQYRAQIENVISTVNPNLDVQVGAFHDLIVHFSSVLAASTAEAIQKVMKSVRLEQIRDQPETADPKIVDELAAQFRLTRRPARKATGKLMLVFSQDQNLVVAADSIYKASNLVFRATKTFYLKSNPAEILTDADRILSQIDVGLYAAVIDVIADKPGQAYNLRHGVSAFPEIPLPDFVRAFVFGATAGGAEEESNTQLAARILTGRHYPSWSHRDGIESLIRQESGIDTIEAVSVVGCGDPGMLRDRSTPWPGGVGGKVDVYVRTAPECIDVVVEKSALLIAKTGSVGTWQVHLTRNDAPAFYEIDRVVLPSSATPGSGFAVQTETRNYDPSPLAQDAFSPAFSSTIEAVYTPFQTAYITFVDSVTDASAMTVGTSTKTYHIVLRAIPGVDEVQKKCTSRDLRPAAYDVLIKAPVPCWAGVSATVWLAKDSPLPDEAAVRREIAAAVNRINFSDRIPISTVVSAAQKAVQTGLRGVSNIILQGRIRRPDGTIWTQTSQSELIFPDEPQKMVWKNTISVFCRPEDVAVVFQYEQT